MATKSKPVKKENPPIPLKTKYLIKFTSSSIDDLVVEGHSAEYYGKFIIIQEEYYYMDSDQNVSTTTKNIAHFNSEHVLFIIEKKGEE
jgi:hypothetical protein